MIWLFGVEPTTENYHKIFKIPFLCIVAQKATMRPGPTSDGLQRIPAIFQLSTMRMQRTQCAQWMLWYRLVLFAWTAVLIAGGAVAWKFISERGFHLPAIPGAMP